MEEQGSFFGPDEHRTAWSKEEGDSRLAKIRNGLRQTQVDRYARGHEAQTRVSDQFHDRRI